MWKFYMGEFSGDQLLGTELERRIGSQKAGLSCNYNSRLRRVLQGGFPNLAGPSALPEVALVSPQQPAACHTSTCQGECDLGRGSPVSKGKSRAEL